MKTSILLKVTLIAVIGLLLLIPASMIKSLIREREQTKEAAIYEVSSKWGETQTLSGPYLSVPYYKYVKQISSKDSVARMVQVKEYLHFLPKALKINGELLPERRNRGIYEVVVYNSDLRITGEFSAIAANDFEVDPKDIQFDKAVLTIGISDLRGIEKQVSLKWNNSEHLFNPGTVSTDVIESGINAEVPVSLTDSSTYQFNVSVNLKGSQYLYFTPVGEITDVNMTSIWPNPSFNGAFLPDSREVTDAGFKATWNILHLNRNYPQKWSGNAHNPQSSAFGIDLLVPVDNYQKSMRSVKYAVLFIVFTFLVFFFVEVLNKIHIHPIQYILVGIALIVFYTLLLSVSEHMSFNLAYILSALATLLLVAGYVKAILHTNVLTLLISGILLVLYTFLFVVIQLQDYALLIGSVGLFVILALVMYFSRKIDWYNLKIEGKAAQTPENGH